MAVEVVEEVSAEAESFVQEADGGDERGRQEVFEPLEAGISDWDAEEDDQVLDCAGGCSELGTYFVED